jgi:hypothetical protein
VQSKNQYTPPGRSIDEGDLIAVVLDAAPDEYQAVLTAEQRARGDALSLSDLEIVMSQHWRQIKRDTNGKSDQDGEIVLAAFGGMCYNCKKAGHKANRCPDKDAGGKKKASSAVNVLIVVRLGTNLLIAGKRKRTRINDQLDTRQRATIILEKKRELRLLMEVVPRLNSFCALLLFQVMLHFLMTQMYGLRIQQQLCT